MRHLRVSIGSVLILIALSGVGFAALGHPSPWWSAALFTVVLAVLLFSLLAVLYRRHACRAFWTGFALFGCPYLVMNFVPFCYHEVRPHLVTSIVIDRLEELDPASSQNALALSRTFALTNRSPLKLNTPLGLAVMQQAPNTAANTLTLYLTALSPVSQDFRLIGHWLATLLVALFGGIAARIFYTTQGPDS
jgi:hypothetical protein